MSRRSWIKVIVLCVVIAAKSVQCLRDTRLEVVPEIVERGSEATLRCHYVLENNTLYSLKWYRGKHEFYRYSPNGDPTTKVFKISGLEVDRSKSNESQVTIRNVEFAVAGNFSCEATADAPSFTTEVDWKKLIVVSLPRGSPVIATERDRYDPGDTLKANCTAQPSEPPATISFTLNNQLVGESSSKRLSQRQYKPNHNSKERLTSSSSYNVHQQDQQHQVWGDLQWNELELTLQPFHYVNGQLNLRCIVEIPKIYNATSELQLGAGLREPVPERVTSENTAIKASSLTSLTLLCLSLLHTLMR
ncbi:uncharacterized protein [Venturia canescens]|uniref:uncharacterized protein n=1 Tax=Venturia canescens TaxID=32260 RepID=UPI001C9BC101|nr:uncharacterized protein LOC122408136 [Venturia canescens]